MDAAEFEKHERLEADHWWFEGRRRCIAAVLETQLKTVPRRRILDVGCGTGGMFPLLKRFGAVSGAEFSPDARARATRLYPDVAVSACALPGDVPQGPFELITAFDVLEHLDEPQASARALAERLAPGGQLLVTVPAFQFLWSAHDVALQHRRRYSARLLREHLEAGGLRITWHSFFNSSLFPAVVAARLVGRLRSKNSAEGASDLKPLPKLLNGALTTVFGAEGRLLRTRRLPVGVSLIAMAEKP
jgi:SAM-dependent methyltransferase